MHALELVYDLRIFFFKTPSYLLLHQIPIFKSGISKK